MALFNKRPTAEKLGEQLAALDLEIKRLASEAAQAERDATAAAADESAYPKAAECAAELARRLTDAKSRRERLAVVHRDAETAAIDAEILRLEGELLAAHEAANEAGRISEEWTRTVDARTQEIRNGAQSALGIYSHLQYQIRQLKNTRSLRPNPVS